MAAAAEAANNQVREFHVHFRETVMKAVPALRRSKDLPPEQLAQITSQTVEELMATLPEGSKERQKLEAEFAKIGTPEQKSWTLQQKLGAGAIVGGGSISLICHAVSEGMHHANMSGIEEARAEACRLIDAGRSTQASKLLKESGSMTVPNRKLTPADAAHIRKNHESSTTQSNAHTNANWADYVAIVGSSVQLLSALAMLGYTIHIRSQVIRDCTVDDVDEEGKATWLHILNEQRKLLSALIEEYNEFLDDDVAGLGTGGSLDSDGITPVWMRYSDFVTRTQSIVIETMNLALEVQKKSTELANHLWSAGTMTAGAAVQAGVALAQALARPNPATWVNFGLLAGTTAAGLATVGLTVSAQGYLRDFDKEVNNTLVAAKAFLAKMTKGRDMAKEEMVKYKALQSQLKSTIQIALEEEEKKAKAAEEAAQAKDKELEELRRLLAASRAQVASSGGA